MGQEERTVRFDHDLQGNETHEEGLIREVKEETGFVSLRNQFFWVSSWLIQPYKITK